jgi:hypothetical protein
MVNVPYVSCVLEQPTSPATIRLGWKCLTVANVLAFHTMIMISNTALVPEEVLKEACREKSFKKFYHNEIS